MEDKKIPFFIRVKKAIFNFDEYQTFAMEKTRKAIFYYLILMLIVSLFISIAFTYKIYGTVNKITQELEVILPDFRIENNELILAAGEIGVVFGEESYNLNIIMDDQKTEATGEGYNNTLLILKDRIVLNYFDISQTMTYEELFKDAGDSVTKQDVFDYLNSSEMIGIYLMFFVFTLISIFITHIFSILVYGISILTLLGLVVSHIFKVNLKIKEIFNMSFYAMTLSILLYMIYIAITLLMGFELKYFNIAYNGISYIYITTAILMIKSDLIKQQMELMKIIEVQGQVRQELEEKKEEERKKEKEEKPEGAKDEKEKKTGKKKEPKSSPEGSKA